MLKVPQASLHRICDSHPVMAGYGEPSGPAAVEQVPVRHRIGQHGGTDHNVHERCTASGAGWTGQVVSAAGCPDPPLCV